MARRGCWRAGTLVLFYVLVLLGAALVLRFVAPPARVAAPSLFVALVALLVGASMVGGAEQQRGTALLVYGAWVASGALHALAGVFVPAGIEYAVAAANLVISLVVDFLMRPPWLMPAGMHRAFAIVLALVMVVPVRSASLFCGGVGALVFRVLALGVAFAAHDAHLAHQWRAARRKPAERAAVYYAFVSSFFVRGQFILFVNVWVVVAATTLYATLYVAAAAYAWKYPRGDDDDLERGAAEHEPTIVAAAASVYPMTATSVFAHVSAANPARNPMSVRHPPSVRAADEAFHYTPSPSPPSSSPQPTMIVTSHHRTAPAPTHPFTAGCSCVACASIRGVISKPRHESTYV